MNFSLPIPTDVSVQWVSDLLLLKEYHNRSSLDVTSSFHWDVTLSCVLLLLNYLVSATLNSFLLILMIDQRRKGRSLKCKLMVGTMTAVNIVWSITWICVIGASYILKEDDDIMSVLESEEEEDEELRQGIWEVIAHQIIDNLLAVRALLLLAISLDRYLNLFNEYSPYVENFCMKISIIFTPFLLAWTLFDHRTISWFLPEYSALFCRLCLLLCPCLLSFLFSLIASLRPTPKSSFEPRLTSSLSKSFPKVMLFIVFLEIVYRTSFFFRLLEIDFDFLIVTGSEEGDQAVQRIFDILNALGSWLLHLFTFYFPACLIFFVRHYRIQVSRAVQSARVAAGCGGTDMRVDYSSETMRSIMADHKRHRQLVSSIH